MAKRLTEDEIRWILSLDASEAEREANKLSKESARLTERNKELRQSMSRLEAQGKKNSDNYRTLSDEYARNGEKLQKNRAELKRLDEQMGLANLTMTQLRRRARDLQRQLDGTSQALHPEDWSRLNAELTKTRQRMAELKNSAGQIEEQMDGTVKWIDKAKLAVKAFIAVKAVGWLKSVHEQAYKTRKEFAQYEAVLRNTFQSQERANDAMRMLQQLATNTPSSLQEWTEGFIKLVNRGIEPTSQELMRLGDLAASQGKSLDQLIEAVLDAMTGENERLKEFGIRASKEGDKTRFTFRGVTTEVRNSEEAIKDYLISLGQIEGIAGAMAVQMEELKGVQSNLSDSMDAFFNKIGKKLEPFWKNAMKMAKSFFDGMGEIFTTYTETYDSHFEKMVQLESALPKLMLRYEELTSKSSLSVSEQKELASVISQITGMVPGAAVAFNDYGEAIALSTVKVDEFVKKQRALLRYENAKAIEETEKELERLRVQYTLLLAEQRRGGREVSVPNAAGMPYRYIDDSDEMKAEIEKGIADIGGQIEGAEQKLKRLNGDTIEEAIKQRQAMIDAREKFNSMNKRQLEAWIKDEKNAASEYLSVAKEIFEKKYSNNIPQSGSTPSGGSREDPKAEAEREARAVVDTEKAAAQSLRDLREEELTARRKWLDDSRAALMESLNAGKISREQHEMMTLELEKEYAGEMLRIERAYYDDSMSMALTDTETKEALVRESAGRVAEAEKAANAARLAEQAKLSALVKDFKQQFKLTTVDEDYQAQLAVLEASYRARREMAEKNRLDTAELDKAYYRAKEQLESDHQRRLQSIRSQYGLASQQEKYAMELEQLKAALDQQLLTQEEYERAVQNLKRDSYKTQFDYYSNLFSGSIAALQQAELANVDARYDTEIEAAKGNAEEVERLENEKAEKKLEIQKKYADVNFAITVSQIIADTATAVMKAFADLGPIAGAVAAALMTATGAAQIAAANAERQKVKNMTLSGSDGSSSSQSYERVVTGKESGGRIDVVREQDGKLFPGADYDPDRRGFVDRPTVIVGEGPRGRSKEWVASNAAVENPTVAPILDIIDRSQQAGTIRTLDLNRVIQARMAGYAGGGAVDAPSSASPSPRTLSPERAVSSTTMERLAAVLERLERDGIPATVALSELERKRQLRDRGRKIGSKS